MAEQIKLLMTEQIKLPKQYWGKLFCLKIETDDDKASYMYSHIDTGDLIRGRLHGRLFSNTAYPKEELEKGNKWLKRWRAGLEIKCNCDVCAIKFYCYTNRI